VGPWHNAIGFFVNGIRSFYYYSVLFCTTGTPQKTKEKITKKMTQTGAETKKSQGGRERKDRAENGEDGAVIAIHPYFKCTRDPSMKWLSVLSPISDCELRGMRPV
jgi:hypothetical protein